MPYILNLLYLLLLLAASPWLLYSSIRKQKYREGFAAKFLGRSPKRTGNRPCIWLHAVSVGEVNLLKPLLAHLEQEYPGHDCVISTTTKTGFELARQKYAPRPVFYCPLDFTWAVRSALRRLQPELLILTELELWPNLIYAAHRQGVKVAVVNGRLSEKSLRGYRWIHWFMARTLARLDLIAVQNREYADRFLKLGARPESLCITGSIKFDGATTDRSNSHTQRLSKLAGIRSNDIVFLAGSTQAPEEALALASFQQLSTTFPSLRLILVPRHPERFDEVAKLLDDARLPWQRRSRLNDSTTTADARVLLVDTVGELGGWWGTAHLAFVGGSMGSRGGQNMIEPAAYGAAVSFGTNTRNFRDVVELMLSHQAATVLADGQDLTQWLARCLKNPENVRDIGQRAQKLVLDQQGATQRTMRLLAPLLQKNQTVEKDRQRAA